jgi:hypothetical protein
MPEFRTAPEALADASRAVAADGRLAEQVAGALRASLADVGHALPGSRTAGEAAGLSEDLVARARTVAAELATVAAALAIAAREYAATDASVAVELGRRARWSA